MLETLEEKAGKMSLVDKPEEVKVPSGASDSDDDVPNLEEEKDVPQGAQGGAGPLMGGESSGDAGSKQSRSEKKARKMLLKV